MTDLPEPSLDGFVRVRGARVHNLRDVDVDVPRDALVVFTGVSGSGQVLAGVRHAVRRGAAPLPRVGGAVRPSAAPAGRRPAGRVEITGLPPAVALQQRRGAASARSTVGTLTTLSNSLRMLYSRAGTYPPGAPRLDSDAFSPNTVAGACPECHGLGRVHLATEESLVPDPSLSIRERAIAVVARCLAGQEPARHPRHPRPRRRQAVARARPGRPRLDPLHRRAAGGDRPPRARGRADPAPLPGQVPERPPARAAHPGGLPQRDHAPADAPVRADGAVPGLRRVPAAARGAGRHVRRPAHRRARRPAAGRPGRRAAPGPGRRGG